MTSTDQRQASPAPAAKARTRGTKRRDVGTSRPKEAERLLVIHEEPPERGNRAPRSIFRRRPATGAASAARRAAPKEPKDRGHARGRRGRGRSVDRQGTGRDVRATPARVRHAIMSPLDAVDVARGWVAGHRIVMGALAVLVVVVVALFGPVKNYYVAVRTGQVLQQRYDEVSAQNVELRQDDDRLQSQEGIEDEARRRGYVSKGETPVEVEGGQDGSQQDDPTTPETYPDQRAWYVRVLDALFGYDPETTWDG